MTTQEPLFYCAALDASGEIVLTGDEANHVRAQRLKPGDSLVLFDGRGAVAHGSVRSIGRREIVVAVTQYRHEPPPATRFELYSAVPKGDRVAVLLDMATQLGLARFTPVRWARGVVDPGVKARDRWRRICIEACKQSRRLHLPEVAATATLDGALADARGRGAHVFLAHPDGGLKSPLAPEATTTTRIALFVGPEGGLTDDELETIQGSGAKLVCLGDGILRIETAAVALIAAVIAARDLLRAARS